MITLGDLKTFFSTGTVNQALSGTNSMLGQIVHWVVTDIISTADFWWNQESDSFDTVDGTAQYFLNNRVFMDKIWGMYDEDNEWPLTKKELKSFYDWDPTPTDEGDAHFWAYVGQATCQAVPTAAGTISFSSSSASDTTIRAVIKGKVSNIERYEILTANGTSSVAGTLSWDASVPISINLENEAVGLMTFTRGVTVAQIPPGHLRVLRPHIRLYQVPGTTGDTIRYFYYKRSVPLVSDYEIVDLPDSAFKTLRYGIEEIAYFLTSKLQASNNSFNKYKEAKEELVSWSERDIAGNELKNVRESVPFAFRLPETISGSVTE